jgi:hypothetical protein
MNGRIRSIEFHIDTSPLIRKGRGFIHWLPGREQVSAFSQHSEELRLALRGMAPSPTPKRDHGDPLMGTEVVRFPEHGRRLEATPSQRGVP